MKNNKKGFTLIELLVVIAIIGLLATLSVVALNNARQKSRDAKRVSDIKQIQTALELYFVDADAYPATLGTSISLNGTTYMGQVPENPTPAGTNGCDYEYTSADPYDTYTLTFCLEGTTGGLSSGTRTATPDGIQ